jgi:hypothetical protein
MRALAAEGVLAMDDQQRFALTPLGATLRSDVPGSLHDWALLMLGPVNQDAWREVAHTVRTGQSAFRHRFAMDLWEYRSLHPEYAKVFDRAMAGFTRTYVEQLLRSYSFATFTTIIDVGGGDGTLLIRILESNPHIRGIVFDLPHVAARAAQRVRAAGLDMRCTASGGNAFEAVPPGGDAYVLSRVIHDWDDDGARALLLNCRKALAPGGRVLVIERAMPDGAHAGPSPQSPTLSDIHMTDLNMMVMTDGRERKLIEYQELFAEAGLSFVRIVRTQTAMNVMEAQLASHE